MTNIQPPKNFYPYKTYNIECDIRNGQLHVNLEGHGGCKNTTQPSVAYFSSLSNTSSSSCSSYKNASYSIPDVRKIFTHGILSNNLFD